MKHLKRGRPFVCVAAACFVLAVTPGADCRVFQRVGAAGTAAKRLESIGATQAYQSRVTVNGVGADLTVFSFDAPLAEVIGRVRGTFGTNVLSETGGGPATGALAEGDRPVHLMVSEAEGSKTLVFLMLLDRAPDRSAAPPWPVTAIPLMPGSTTVFSFENTSTRMRFGIARTPDTAEAAKTYCDRHLKSRGWEPQGVPQASLVVYARKQDLCLVMVQAPSKPGEDTRIAVLEKRLGTP